jgi:hypothetical protein
MEQIPPEYVMIKKQEYEKMIKAFIYYEKQKEKSRVRAKRLYELKKAEKMADEYVLENAS